MNSERSDERRDGDVISGLANSIASAISHGALDERQQRIRDLLIEFAAEIKREAIEP